MPRYFTLKQAQRLLPEVARSVRRAMDLKVDYDACEGRIRKATQRIVSLGGSIVDRQQFAVEKMNRDSALEALKEAVNEIREVGCQVKDLDTGLIDFPTLYRGEEVLLCWRMGETDITYWHSTEEGFRGRKPIDEDFLQHHRGDGVN